MPSLGADMDFGTVVEWHVRPGDHVARGDIIADVDTDKSVIEVEVFLAGTVERILVAEGERVPVGAPLAVLREDAAAPGQPGRDVPPRPPSMSEVPPPPPSTSLAPSAPDLPPPAVADRSEVPAPDPAYLRAAGGPEGPAGFDPPGQGPA